MAPVRAAFLDRDGVLIRSDVQNGKPIAIMMKTAMGFGVDFMMNDHNWHGIAPNNDQLAAALAQLPETLGDY